MGQGGGVAVRHGDYRSQERCGSATPTASKQQWSGSDSSEDARRVRRVNLTTNATASSHHTPRPSRPGPGGKQRGCCPLRASHRHGMHRAKTRGVWASGSGGGLASTDAGVARLSLPKLTEKRGSHRQAALTASETVCLLWVKSTHTVGWGKPTAGVTTKQYYPAGALAHPASARQPVHCDSHRGARVRGAPTTRRLEFPSIACVSAAASAG